MPGRTRKETDPPRGWPRKRPGARALLILLLPLLLLPGGNWILCLHGGGLGVHLLSAEFSFRASLAAPASRPDLPGHAGGEKAALHARLAQPALPQGTRVSFRPPSGGGILLSAGLGDERRDPSSLKGFSASSFLFESPPSAALRSVRLLL